MPLAITSQVPMRRLVFAVQLCGDGDRTPLTTPGVTGRACHTPASPGRGVLLQAHTPSCMGGWCPPSPLWPRGQAEGGCDTGHAHSTHGQRYHSVALSEWPS